jgi:hypothetical protein
MTESNQEKQPLSEARSKLVDRFRAAVKREKRRKKIEKLQTSDEWSGLESFNYLQKKQSQKTKNAH